MNDTNYELAHKIATINQHKVAELIPKKIIQKEEKLLQKFTNSTGSASNKLKSLYRFMDELYSHVHKITPCHKGCSNCCHFNVSISQFEADFIAKETNTTKITQPQNHQKDFHGVPCPFLKQDVCSIYLSRPFVCRRHIFLGDTEKWCSPNIANDYEFPQLGFSEIKATYDFILQESKLTRRKDIREFFASI